MTAALGGKQRRYLRALGHDLEPAVRLGGSGITDGVLATIEQSLAAHELIKVRLFEAAGAERKAAARELAERAGAALVQVLGRTVLLYRARDERPEIVLPE
jgi:RNA-binding protein